MSSLSKSTVRVQSPLTSQEEEDLYFQEPGQPAIVVVGVESFRKDVICTQCGLWQSEHNWDLCRTPNWS